MKNSVAVPFALAGATVLSPLSQAVAGETTAILDHGDTAIMQGGGTRVEADGSGNVKVYVNGAGSVAVHINGTIYVYPAANDAAAPVKPGDELPDGTVFAGSGLSTASADAPRTSTWHGGKRYCENLVANGHDDWRLPSKAELNILYNNRAAIGGFDVSGSFPAGYYWSSSEGNYTSAWNQRFSDGVQAGSYKRFSGLSVRCVR